MDFLKMKNAGLTIYPIIGMSPGNSYFKDEEIQFLLETITKRFGRVGVLIADIPAISTYVALGYPENRARRDKAIPKGNALKNRVAKVVEKLGYSRDVVRVFDWGNEIENNSEYQDSYRRVSDLYENNKAFHSAVRSTTRNVLETSEKPLSDIETAITLACHYLLSEFAFLEFAPKYLGVDQVVYIYHKNWEVYENYIAGMFDGVVRSHLDFLLLENPYETRRSMWGMEEEEAEGEYLDTLDRVEKTKILRVGFAFYPPAFLFDHDYKNLSGIFYEIVMEIAKKQGWVVRWSEEVGYGVVIHGLQQHRFDIFGSTIWPTPERLKDADFSHSLYQSPVFVWGRPREQLSLEEMKKQETFRVAVKENDISDSIAMSDFLNHRKVRVPQLADPMDILKRVEENQADMTFAEPYLVELFNQNSSVKLVKLEDQPIRTYGNTFMVRKGETRFLQLWNRELELLKQEGVIERLIETYTDFKETVIIE